MLINPEQMKARKTSRKHPDYLMRAVWHDYRRPSDYLITFTASPDLPPLSQIIQTESSPKLRADTRLLPIGVLVSKIINILPGEFPHIIVRDFVIMPDHVHIALSVMERTDIHLGKIISSLKGKITSLYRESFPNSPLTLEKRSIWTKGFNDKIAVNPDMFDNFKRYINENPLRAFIRKAHPEFFTKGWMVEIVGKNYEVFGNPLLLRHPIKGGVQYSRRFTDAEKQNRLNRIHEVIRQGGVLVSPFIHAKEKELMEEGIINGASLILIRERGFPERFKPEGRLFDLCKEGRLLIIALNGYSTRNEKVTRSECLSMNELARLIAADQFSMEPGASLP